MKKYIVVVMIIGIFVSLSICKTQNNIYEENAIIEVNKQQDQYQKPIAYQIADINKIKEPSRHIEYKIYDIPLPVKDQILIQEEARKYSLSPEFIFAIIQAESTFNTKAISHDKSSKGLMQLNINTYKWIAKELKINNFDPYNSNNNIRVGVWYINYLREYWYSQGYNDENVFNLILISYNQGIEGCNKHIKKYGLKSKYATKVEENKYNIEINN